MNVVSEPLQVKSRWLAGLIGLAVGGLFGLLGALATYLMVLVVSTVVFTALCPFGLLLWSNYPRWIAFVTIVGILIGTFTALWFGMRGVMHALLLPRWLDGSIEKSAVAGVIAGVVGDAGGVGDGESVGGGTHLVHLLFLLGPLLISPLAKAISESLDTSYKPRWEETQVSGCLSMVVAAVLTAAVCFGPASHSLDWLHEMSRSPDIRPPASQHPKP